MIMQVTARWQLARGINLVVAACEMAGMLSTNATAKSIITHTHRTIVTLAKDLTTLHHHAPPYCCTSVAFRPCQTYTDKGRNAKCQREQHAGGGGGGDGGGGGGGGGGGAPCL